MIRDLLEAKMSDGSRHFVDMPEVVFFDDLADSVDDFIFKEVNLNLCDICKENIDSNTDVSWTDYEGFLKFFLEASAGIWIGSFFTLFYGHKLYVSG